MKLTHALILDNNRAVTRAIHHVLAHHNVCVRSDLGVERLLQELGSGTCPYGVIFLDPRIPEYDKIVAAGCLLQPPAAFVLICGAPEYGYLLPEAYQSSEAVRACLRKPFQPKDLLTLLSQCGWELPARQGAIQQPASEEAVRIVPVGPVKDSDKASQPGLVVSQTEEIRRFVEQYCREHFAEIASQVVREELKQLVAPPVSRPHGRDSTGSENL